MTRLSDQERLERVMTGAKVQLIVVEVATALGWLWSHWRPLQNRRGFWQTPVEGPLGTGWPDLFLANPVAGRVLGIECKRELGDPVTPEQSWVHEQLRSSGIPIFVLRPSDVRDPLETSILMGILLGHPVAPSTGSPR